MTLLELIEPEWVSYPECSECDMPMPKDMLIGGICQSYQEALL